MDVDAFVVAHRPTWDRLEQLVKRRRRLTGAEVDELVDLYQRVSTHLSMVRSASQDSVLVGRLSGLVARARAAVTGAHAPLWREFVRFWTVSFPVVAYRAWRWWLGSAVAFFIVTAALALWVSGNPDVHAAIGTPSEIEELVNHDFASYYSEHPAGSFALQVWVNNSWVAAQCIAFAILLGLPIPYVLFQNAANLGVIAGLMFGADKGDLFLGLIIPHGLLELTAVFLAAAVGMRLGWAVIAPGDRPRSQALAEQGRAVVAAAIGLAVVLLISGLIEALVTPSPLPTWMRIGIGVAAELAFLGYVFHFGRKAARAGESGDLEDAPDVLPTA
ncbi:stage II sporulation protein M [Mycolicibacterium fortuitum]|uniref:Integral membrane protein n=1 Tax=Mycolicibacterium fortuitum subsp. fortuitum DSM 46621 = ATCC 6841 = JCM 6387 TaxID=1214102 RepID=K0UK46_MYCFO|nr:stage II sporulation protein M [Mycolicibacterium fortuitum]AIY48644.1 putative membrane protein [Mycobacterium sp. VKM Ac-1817D]CRL72197.1 integral membrane protein [Mycolicibacter nonchromogenicus]EJZ07211.1 integral membrane protein [Mycolicibacterium fortuitum subsp. fortuitum DSM 46621 = ATCC 6841 = JCM 6387]WEV32358.1 stage II sporulation protein M [Mycolicibacterium fortuitum]CRL54858.1 integral membrane protein [Mycolicibacterium fortuitum subsp. fortuitum DSM 46621 = ATCC 6841 = JC